MDIEKAIKWEKKMLRRFYITMILISVMLPVAMMLAGKNTAFYVGYLAIIEGLIIVAIVMKLNFNRLNYTCANNKLKFKSGIFSKEHLIFCDKVAIVHTEKMEDEMEIILVTTARLRNKSLRPVSKGFLKRYSSVAFEYMAQKELDPEQVFYYQIIKRGGLKKYLLLESIYKNCVKAVYTEEAIENIKIARGQTLV